MCVRPIRAFKVPFKRPQFHPEGDIVLPCGKCHECLTLRASDWGLRTQHELGDHVHNCCVTLTYSDSNLPSIFDRKSQFKLFMKKLRERTKSKILYLVSHELGSENSRLHHHALLFGVSFPDMRPWRTTSKGTKLFRSRTLEKIWTHGHSEIGPASVKTGHYIASYALKSSKQILVNSFGDFEEVTDSMDCSKRPAIGYNYLLNNHRRMVESGERLPRYYQKKLGELYTLSDSELVEKFSKSKVPYSVLLSQMKEMAISLQIYETMQSHNVRTPFDIKTKYEITRSKISNSSSLRSNIFTKSENLRYKLDMRELSRNLTLEYL